MITVLPKPGGNLLTDPNGFVTWVTQSTQYATRDEAIQFFIDNKIKARLENKSMGWIIDTRTADPTAALFSTIATFIPFVGPIYAAARNYFQPGLFSTGMDAAALQQQPGPGPGQQQSGPGLNLNDILKSPNTKYVGIGIAALIFVWLFSGSDEEE